VSTDVDSCVRVQDSFLPNHCLVVAHVLSLNILSVMQAKEPAREKKVLLSAAMVPQCLEAFRLLFPAQLYIVHVAPIHSCLALNFTILLTPSNVLISTSEGTLLLIRSLRSTH